MLKHNPNRPNQKELVIAREYLPSEEEVQKESGLLYDAERDGTLLKLFGILPDYSQPEFEELWQQVDHGKAADAVDYCREHGVDITDKHGNPIPIWRDIAVMLMAQERGYMS